MDLAAPLAPEEVELIEEVGFAVVDGFFDSQVEAPGGLVHRVSELLLEREDGLVEAFGGRSAHPASLEGRQGCEELAPLFGPGRLRRLTLRCDRRARRRCVAGTSGLVSRRGD
jgi:hypothetical protein